jgi:hypothetical protein
LSPNWTHQPRPGFQHLLRETDAIGLDPAALIDDVVAAGADTYIAMAGGFSAWYPGASAGQVVNPHLEADLVGGAVEACRRQGIRVLARMDLSKGRSADDGDPAGRYVRTAEGAISTVWTLPQTCATGPVWEEEVFAILSEITARYRPDGFFFNYYSVPRCHCRRCSDIVLAETGAPVPAPGTRSPVYEAWRQQRLAGLSRRIADHMHGLDPDLAFVPYHHVRDGWDLPAMAATADLWSAQISNPLVVNPVDPQPVWRYWAAEEALLGKSLKPGAAPLLVQTSSGFFASRQVALPPARLTANAMQAAAHGASVLPSINGTMSVGDTRAMPAVSALGQHLAAHSEWYRDLASPARIGILRSEASRLWGTDAGRPAGDPAGNGHIAEFRGLFSLLSALGYPLSVLASGAITAESLAGLDLLVLPATSCLSDADAAAIDAFVARGGTLIATGDTGACTEGGTPRPAPPLATLPALPGPARPVAGGYFRLADDAPSLGLPGLAVIGADGPFWQPETGAGWTARLGLVGPFANNAPEFTVLGDEIGPPGLLSRRHGDGQVHWLPWRPGALYGRAAIDDCRALMGSLISDAVGPAPIRVPHPAIEAVLMDHPRGALVHLINGAVPVGEPFVAPVPLAGFTFAVALPVAEAHLLGPGTSLPVRRNGQWSEIDLPGLSQFAAIALVEDRL